MARKIAQLGGLDAHAADNSFAAGLLHDIGKLVMMAERAADWKIILATVEAEKTNLWSAEQQVLGCSHAQIGAHLLGIWGLPGAIVEAVAWHHSPSHNPVTQFSPLTAVHLADCYHASLQPFRIHEPVLVDSAFLKGCGIEEKEPQYRTACETLLHNAQ
jgi:HD-like signal output (HDOD) protein